MNKKNNGSKEVNTAVKEPAEIVLDETQFEEHFEKKTPNIPVKKETQVTDSKDGHVIINCLRKQRVIARYIMKKSTLITNEKHIEYGGMISGSKRIFTVPMLRNGVYPNILTNDEKEYLEQIMGLEYNTLSVYKTKDNFWDNFQVVLGKEDTYFDLSIPMDYIKYKVLLTNTDFICPSLEELRDRYKETYQYVLINEGEETEEADARISTTMKCYQEFGKIEEDVDRMRVIVETMDRRPTAKTVSIVFLKNKINDLIQQDSRKFISIITDPLLGTKVLIKKGIEFGVISKRGEYYYLRKDNSPLCEANENPNLLTAAKYLNNPKHQEIKFTIEAQTK